MGQVASQRILTVLEKPLAQRLSRLARRDGVSLSQKVRDLVRDGIERDEDADLLALAEKRRRQPARWLGHDEFWHRAGSR
jgi:class 3 adenylate cyclase